MLLSKTLDIHDNRNPFIYFGTCAVYDIESISLPYTKHKLAMEQLVLEKPNRNIFRLPHVGEPNAAENTLMRYFYSKIKNR